MGKWLKIVLSLFALLLLLAIVAAAALMIWVDPNDFKPEIEAQVKKQTGRKLTIDGDLTLSVFPWLGVSTGKMTLAGTQGVSDQHLAEIEAGDIKVKLLPLLSKQMEVNRVLLKGLQLNLVTDADGRKNWENIKPQKQAKKAQTDQPPKTKAEKDSISMIDAMVIGGIDLEDGRIIWDDRKQQQRIELQKLNLKTESLEFDQPVDMDLSVTIVSTEPAITEQLQINTAIIVDEKFQSFSFNELTLASVTLADNLPGGKINSKATANVSVDLAKQTLAIADLKLAINALKLTADLTGSQIVDNPQISGPVAIGQFNLREWLQQLGVDMPAMRDPGSLQTMAVQFDLTSSGDALKLKQLKMQLDESNVNGHVSINDLETQALAFKLNLDKIDLDRYREPEDAPTKSKDKKPANDGQPVAPISAAATASLFPVTTLKEFNANGQLTIGKLTMDGLTMSDINVNLKANNGIVETQQKVGRFYRGEYSGKARLNTRVNPPQIAINERLIDVELGALLKDLNGVDRITGTTDARANLKGRGNSVEAIKASLAGTMSVKIFSGKIKGFDLQQTLDDPKSILDKQALIKFDNNKATKFTELSASAKVNNGVLKNKDLSGISSALQVKGKGTVNLVNEALDYKVKVKINSSDSASKRLKKLSGVPIAIKLGGTISKPTYRIDLQSILVEKNREEIERQKQKLLDKVDKKLGKKYGDKANELLKKLF